MTDPYADLPPIERLSLDPTDMPTLSVCGRCKGLAPITLWADHERWHRAVESAGASAPTQTEQPVGEFQPLRDQLIERFNLLSDGDPVEDGNWLIDQLMRVIEPHIEAFASRATTAEAALAARSGGTQTEQALRALDRSLNMMTVRYEREAARIADYERETREAHDALARACSKINQLDQRATRSETRNSELVQQLQRSNDLVVELRKHVDVLERKRQDCAEHHTPAFEPPAPVETRLALPDGWEDELESHGRDDDCAVPLDTVVGLVRGWATHVCEAHCTRHDDEPRVDPELAAKISQAIHDPGKFVDRARTWDDTFYRWEYESVAAWGGRAVIEVLNSVDADVDVPEQELAEIHQASEWGTAEQAAEWAKGEACPLLYLHHGTLLTCTVTDRPGHTAHYSGQNDAVTGHEIAWGTSEAVSSPWPLDQEPPAGIDTLRDTDGDVTLGYYLCRAEKHWAWNNQPTITGGPIKLLSWVEAVLDADGDLHVVRP